MAHKITVDQKQQQIDSLNAKLEEYIKANAALESAQSTNLLTISGLKSQIENQNQAIATLNNRSDELQQEINGYLSIFNRHDLTKLSRAKPGMIENRINGGTKAVFSQIETDSKELIANE